MAVTFTFPVAITKAAFLIDPGVVEGKADLSPGASRTRVWIVSPSRRLRQALVALIERDQALLHAGDSPSVHAAKLTLLDSPVDVVLSSFPPANALDVLLWREIRDQGMRLIMLPPDLNEREAILSVLAGASGLLPQRVGQGHAVVTVIIDVARGGSCLPGVTVRMLSDVAAGTRPSPLSAKERSLLASLLSNKRVREIASGSHTEIGRVRGYLASMCDKLA